MKDITWMLVASAAGAKIYVVEHRKHCLLKEMAHPESRLKSGELASDRAGHFQKGAAAGGQFEPRSNPHHEAHREFAKELAANLALAHNNHEYTQLILCAEPRFHGLLNEAMSDAVQKCIIKTVAKDYIPLPEAQLNEALTKLLQEPS